MKKIAIAIVAVIALLANVNLSAQSVDDQIAQINAMDRDVVFNMLAMTIQHSPLSKEPNIRINSDQRSRTITITMRFDKEIGNKATAAQLKSIMLKELAGNSKDQRRLAKAVFARGQITVIYKVVGNDKTLSCTLTAADIQ